MDNEFEKYPNPEEYKDIEINCVFDIPTLLCIISQVQLATRHPDNNGPVMQIAVQACKKLQGVIKDSVPEINELIEKGWEAKFDM